MEERLENMLGRDFFQDQKYVLFVVFSLVLIVLLLCCCFLCAQGICRRIAGKNRINSSVISDPMYQAVTVPFSSSKPPVMFNDLEASFPDEAFLENRKIYPGYL